VIGSVVVVVVSSVDLNGMGRTANDKSYVGTMDDDRMDKQTTVRREINAHLTT
jgi:hypothetical protein